MPPCWGSGTQVVCCRSRAPALSYPLPTKRPAFWQVRVFSQKGLTVKMSQSQAGQREPRKRWRPAPGSCLPVLSHKKACLGSLPTTRSLHSLFPLPDTARLPVSSAPLPPSDLRRTPLSGKPSRVARVPLRFPSRLLFTLTQPLLNSDLCY